MFKRTSNCRPTVVCKTPSLNPVQKQYQSICDINNIVRRAFAGDTTVFRAARCMDISRAPETLHEALQTRVDAANAYDALPDSVKAVYPTPEAFYAACHDKTQVEKLRSLGVAEPETIDSPVKVEVVNNPSQVEDPA